MKNTNRKLTHKQAKEALKLIQGGTPKETISVFEDFHMQVSKTIEELQEHKKHKIFQRAGQVVHVANFSGSAEIRDMTVASLMVLSSQSVNYVKNKKFTKPPRDLMQAILDIPVQIFPELVGVTGLPIFSRTGALNLQAGYDPDTKYFFHPDFNCGLLSNMDHSNPAAVAACETIKNSILGDFKFQDRFSSVNAMGLLITPFCKGLFSDKPLMGLISGDRPGVGKSLLTDIVCLIPTGKMAPKKQLPVSDEELNKMIFADLLSGQKFIIFDNVRPGQKINSSALCSVITDRIFSGRILQLSKNMDCASNAQVIANGNNLQIGGDMPRRCFWINLIAENSSPHMRNDYREKDLLGYIEKNRSDLIKNIYTMILSWIDAGMKPGQSPRPGNASDWAGVVSGILDHAGLPGFLGNYLTSYDTASNDANDIAVFLAELHEQTGGSQLTAKEIVSRFFKMNQDDEKSFSILGECLPGSWRDFDSSKLSDINLSNFSKKIGKKFGNIKNSWFKLDNSEYRLTSAGRDKTNNSAAWKVEKQ